MGPRKQSFFLPWSNFRLSNLLKFSGLFYVLTTIKIRASLATAPVIAVFIIIVIILVYLLNKIYRS